MFERPQRAEIVVHWRKGKTSVDEPIQVQYNPTEITLEKNVHIADIEIPALDAPLKQFVRGGSEKLTLELFFDTTEKGMGAGATSVTTETDKIYQLTKIEASRHAPPICTFKWNAKFPGANISDKLGGSQQRTSFTGIVESVRQRFTLFSPEGVPLRATLNVTMAEFKPLHTQLHELNRTSPDRTHRHVVAADERLDTIAAEYYDRASAWRRIADDNQIDDPRRLAAGEFLYVRPLRS
jgi:hypothetical protein